MTWCNFPMNGNYHEPSVDWIINEMKQALNNVDENNDRLDNLEKVVENLSSVVGTIVSNTYSPKNRKYIFLGDSLASGFSPGESTTNGWVYWISNRLGLEENIDYYWPKQTTIDGGFGMAPSVPGSHVSWADILQTFTNDFEYKDTITDIIILGGSNDFIYYTDINAGAQQLDNIIRANYPNAKVTYGVLSGQRSLNRFQNDVQNVFSEYSKLQKFGWSFSKNIVWALHETSYISSDGTHPTQAGYEAISAYVADVVLNGECDVIYKMDGYVPFNSENRNIIIPNRTTFKIVLHNDLTYISVITDDTIPSRLQIQVAQNAPSNARYAIGDLPTFIHARDTEINNIIGLNFLLRERDTETKGIAKIVLELNKLEFEYLSTKNLSSGGSWFDGIISQTVLSSWDS